MSFKDNNGMFLIIKLFLKLVIILLILLFENKSITGN